MSERKIIDPTGKNMDPMCPFTLTLVSNGMAQGWGGAVCVKGGCRFYDADHDKSNGSSSYCKLEQIGMRQRTIEKKLDMILDNQGIEV